MSRIPYPDPASQDDELRDLLSRLGALNVTRMMSHSEGAMKAYSRLGTYLLRKGKLNPVVREAAILRIGQLCKSDYEWHQHTSVALAVGMSEAELGHIEQRSDSELSAPIQAALRVAEEIKADGGASAGTINAAKQHFDAEQLVELILTCGYYIMTAGLLLSLDIEIEDTPALGSAFNS
jgi:4-carboxymuconolactone decarboxylase